MISYQVATIKGIKRGKKMEESSVKELMGYSDYYNRKKKKLTDYDPEFKQFMDSDQY